MITQFDRAIVLHDILDQALPFLKLIAGGLLATWLATALLDSCGKRMSVAHCYLKPAMRRPNLRVITNALTHRVIIEGKRAVGVAYSVHGQKRETRVGREVIVRVNDRGPFTGDRLIDVPSA